MKLRLYVCLITGIGMGCSSGTVPTEQQPPEWQAVHPSNRQPAPWETAVDANRTRASVEYQAKLLDDPDPYVTRQAVERLSDLGKSGVPALLVGMRSDRTAVRLQCLRAIHKSDLVANAKKTLPLLTGMLRDESHIIRKEAVGRMVWFTDDARNTVKASLQRVFDNDKDEEVKSLAANAYVSLHTKLADLTGLLGNSNPLVRYHAAIHLSSLETEGKPSIPVLQQLAQNDPDPRVREAALASITTILNSVGDGGAGEEQ